MLLTKTSPDYKTIEAPDRPRSSPDSSRSVEVTNIITEQEVKPVYYTIPVAAEKAGVNVSTLHKAADRGKLPSQLVNPGTTLEFKVVTVEDVIEWNRKRDPARKGGRPKKSDK